MNSRRAWLVWAVAVVAYIIAVLQRSSLGVSGVEATDRFDVSAAVLSSLAVTQLIVYAALQVPVGVLLDRFGARALIGAGAALMAVGQLGVAVAPSIEAAIAGRILVGAGDAFTFISVIRLLSAWFSGRILPQVSQWTGNLGQLGQVLSAIPLSFLLQQWGWSSAFIASAAASVIAVVLVVLLVSDGPGGHTDTGPIDTSGARSTWSGSLGVLRQSLARPGTRLGFWSHFVTQSCTTVFTLLWGFPLLTSGLGYSPALASGLLTLVVGAGVVAGPIIGVLTARFPTRRSNLVLGIVAVIGICWTAVLITPDEPPVWMVVALVVALGVGGPGSLIGFDFARTFNPRRSLGSANGIVNVGGFLASFVMMFLIGVILDLARRGGSEMYSWEAFRIAFSVQYPVVGIGVVFLVHARRETRRRMHEGEGIQVAPLWVALARAWRRRS